MSSSVATMLLVLAASGPGQLTDRELTGQEVLRLVHEHFYQPERAAAWAKQHDHYARGISDVDTFAATTNRLLGELGASHTQYVTDRDPGYYGLHAIFRGALGPAHVEVEGIGIDVAEGRFVRVVFAGSPAESSKLRRGDEIVSADGRPFHPVESFRGKAGQTVTLGVRRRAGAEPEQVRVVPRKIDAKAEWLEAQRRGAKLYQRHGKVVGYMPLYSGAGEEHEDLVRESFFSTFADADALVLDLRDGWGGCSPTFLDLFNPVAPVLTSTHRNGEKSRFSPHWRKPLVLLINGSSRSGKEVVAFAVKKHRLGTLVGEKTAGAVLAGQPFRLPDGSLLYLAVADSRVDGERIEGKGVEPDVSVPDRLPYAAGADPQLERALDVAAGH